MNRVRFLMIGGFLGAGKTTVIGRLARDYVARGERVGIITNDQASNLVDTHNLRSQGFPVEEIPGSCFCCAFNQLADAVGRLAAAERPDILLGEPVGSCTDLVATVVQPLKRLYADRYVVTPLVVLVDPHRAAKILTRQPRGGFSPKAAYIYEKQLQEADAIAVNKVDTISESQRDEVTELIRQRYPETPLLMISGRTGFGFDDLRSLLDRDGRFGTNIPDVDYDIYAEGEAELGWLNSTLMLSSPRPFALDELLLTLLSEMHRGLIERAAEVAHLKAVASADGREAVANLVRTDAVPELSRASGHRARHAQLILNARVFIDPAELSRLVHECVGRVCTARAIQLQPMAAQHLRPGRPVPTYRYADAV
jgi:G3E family GTPase